MGHRYDIAIGNVAISPTVQHAIIIIIIIVVVIIIIIVIIIIVIVIVIVIVDFSRIASNIKGLWQGSGSSPKV